MSVAKKYTGTTDTAATDGADQNTGHAVKIVRGLH